MWCGRSSPRWPKEQGSPRSSSGSKSHTPLVPRKRGPRAKRKIWMPAFAGMSGEREELVQVGFIGLGAMGALIVPRLMTAGHSVTGWNRSREKAKQLIDAGMAWAD